MSPIDGDAARRWHRFSGVPRPLLVYAAVMSSVPFMAQVSACLFVLAAIAGMVMNLVFHSKGLALPVPLMVAHGLVAIVAFGLLFASL